MDAGQDLDQRALTGPVLTDQAMDLAGQQVQRDAVQRLGSPEPLRDALQRQAGSRRDRLGDRHRKDLDES
jgi:hypothetical protein